jgi:hypothetical protein
VIYQVLGGKHFHFFKPDFREFILGAVIKTKDDLMKSVVSNAEKSKVFWRPYADGCATLRRPLTRTRAGASRGHTRVLPRWQFFGRSGGGVRSTEEWARA